MSANLWFLVGFAAGLVSAFPTAMAFGRRRPYLTGNRYGDVIESKPPSCPPPPPPKR